MSAEPKTRLAWFILGVAGVMGLLADMLLRATPWGANVSVWIALLVAGIFAARKWGGGRVERTSLALMIPMMLFGFCFAWRDSTALQALDLFAIFVAAALVIMRQSAPIWKPTIERVIHGCFTLVGHCAAGFVHLVARDIDWNAQRSSVVAERARGATVGAAIALPLLVVFTALFVRADAAFERFFQSVLHMRIGQHVFPMIAGAWVAGSYIRGVLVPANRNAPPVVMSGFQLGATELNVCLGLINGLFAMFVAVQAQYLFGTEQMVETTPGMTFSGYARRGFFELCAVALLVLPILLGADRWHSVRESKRALRFQSAALTGLVLCIMASALHRMRLYQHEYGLTELRFYTVAFMFWLAFVFVMFCFTVLRDAREQFSIGVVTSGWVAIFALHLLNPDARIAATNLANGRAGRLFDPQYLRALSADAVPVVLANRDALSLEQLSGFVSQRAGALEESTDLRSWNFGREQARKAIAQAGF